MDKQFDKRYFDYKDGRTQRFKDTRDIERIYFPQSIVREQVPRNGRVLDIGCAYGHFLSLCDNYGLETYGVEISDHAVSVASRNTKAKLYKYDVNQGLGLFKDNFFDIVVMFDVIEHIESPFGLLKEAFRILAPSGKLVITTPNLNAIGRYAMKENWHGFKDETHINLFTPLALSFTAQKAGFGILRIETPFQPLPKVVRNITKDLGIGGQIWLAAKKPAK